MTDFANLGNADAVSRKFKDKTQSDAKARAVIQDCAVWALLRHGWLLVSCHRVASFMARFIGFIWEALWTSFSSARSAQFAQSRSSHGAGRRSTLNACPLAPFVHLVLVIAQLLDRAFLVTSDAIGLLRLMRSPQELLTNFKVVVLGGVPTEPPLRQRRSAVIQ